jgi:hypothetical protein
VKAGGKQSHVPPKRRMTLNGLQGVMTELFYIHLALRHNFITAVTIVWM